MKKFIWLHIKKCGGESFRSTYKDYYVETNRLDPKPFLATPREEWNDLLNCYRMPLGEYDFKRMLFAKEHLWTDSFDDLYKFSIVRNPYVRAVSSWKYLTKGKRRLAQLKGGISFKYFLESLPDHWESKGDRHMATHTAPIWPDITDNEGNLLLNKIVKLERFESDFGEVAQEIGLPERPLLKVNFNKKNSDYKRYYSPSIIKLVEDLYSDDIANLEYSL